MNIFPVAIRFYTLLIKNQCVSPTLGIRLNLDFISITRNVNLEDILHLEGGVIQGDFTNLFRISQI